MNDLEIVELIAKKIDPSYLEGSELFLQENKAQFSSYNSVMIKSPKTPYRNAASGNKFILFCRIKNNKNLRYISFPAKYDNDFRKAGVNTSKTQSDKDFIRVDLNDFVEAIDSLQTILNKVFCEAFSFPSFGCCSRYKECSAFEKCTHEDPLYATACMYRKNLESGRNFYKR